MGLLNDLFGLPSSTPNPSYQRSPGSSNTYGNRINVSKGGFQFKPDVTSYDIEKMLGSVVKNPSVRAKMARRFHEGRAGSGLAKWEVDDTINELLKNRDIDEWQAKAYKKDLGSW